MLDRKIEIDSLIEPGEIGEVKVEDGHTYINRLKLNIHVFYITQIIEGVPGLIVRLVRMDEKELESFLAFNIRAREPLYRALDQLSEVERNEILTQYYERGKK